MSLSKSEIVKILTDGFGGKVGSKEITAVAEMITASAGSKGSSSAKSDDRDGLIKQLEQGTITANAYNAEISKIIAEETKLSHARQSASGVLKKYIKETKGLNSAVQFNMKMLAANTSAIRDTIWLESQQIAALEERLALEKKGTDEYKQIIEALAKRHAAQEENNKKLEEAELIERKHNAIKERTKSTIRALTGVTDEWRDTLVGSLMSGKDFSAGLQNMRAQITKTLTPQNILGSTMMKVQEMTVKMALAEDKATVAFRRATNASEGYVDALVSAGRQSRSLGVGVEETGESFQNMYQNIRVFTDLGLSKQQLAQMGRFTNEMRNLGVSAGDSTQMMGYLMDTVQLNKEETEKYIHTLHGMSKSLGIPMAQLSKDFLESRKTMDLYGKAGLTVFKKISASAKKLRTDVAALAGTFEDQFNTFEGAFTTVGRLNSVLSQTGRTIDPLRMMNADLDERMKIVMGTLQGTDIAYKALHGSQQKYYKMMIANAMGTKDVNLVTKMLNGNMGAMNKATKTATQSWSDFLKNGPEGFKKSAKTNTQVMAQLKQLALGFAVGVLPMLQYFGKAIQWINELLENKSWGKFLKWTMGAIGVVGSLAAVMWTLKGTYMGIALLLKPLILLSGLKSAADTKETVTTWASIKAKYAQAAATKAQAATMSAMAPVLMAFAAAAVGVGIAAAGMGLGLKMVGEGFKDMSAGQILAVAVAIGAFSAGLYFLIPAIMASGPTIPLLLGLGAALFLVGAAIGVAAAGFGYMFKHLAQIKPGALGTIAVGLMKLGGALMYMGSFGLLGGLAALAPLKVIESFVENLEGKKVTALESLASILERMDRIQLSGLGNVKKDINDLINDIGRIEEEKVVRFSQVMNATTRATPGMATPSSGSSISASGGSAASASDNAAVIKEFTLAVANLSKALDNQTFKFYLSESGAQELGKVVKKTKAFASNSASGDNTNRYFA